LSPFVLLKKPETYVACSWDLAVDSIGREYWVALFKRHLRLILKLGMEFVRARHGDLVDAEHRAAACAVEVDQLFDAFSDDPTRFGRVTILKMDQWRDGILRKHGFVDAFIDLKNRENETALALLPIVCKELDGLQGKEQFRAVIEGIFAGNIFDMGAEATARKFLAEGINFHDTRARLPRRPWLIDDFDNLEKRMLSGKPHKKCVFFVDNAGSDFLLGAIPMMRWLAKRGTKIILAANERPALNDMTIDDVRAWWPRILDTEPLLRDLPIHPVSSGTGEPLIDLLEVSDELNAAAEGADLLILEGMGRGVESNFNAEFTCDALNIAMLKDPAVAERIGGTMFDLVCRFR